MWEDDLLLIANVSTVSVATYYCFYVVVYAMSLLSTVFIPVFSMLNTWVCHMKAQLYSIHKKIPWLRQARDLKFTNVLFRGLF